MDELQRENKKYSDIEITIIDEGVQPEIANTYDYYYVPTYYVSGEKVHEGVASKEKVRSIFEMALM